MPASAVDKNVFDKGLEFILSNANEAVILTSDPSTFSDTQDTPSSGGLRLGAFNVSSSIMSIEDDGSGGRELVLEEKGYLAPTSDTATHIALVDTESSNLIIYTEYDDGNGNGISVTEDLAYNAGPTTFTLSEFTVA